MINAPEAQSPSQFRCLVSMVLVALVLRLVVMGFLYQEQLDPERDHWRFSLLVRCYGEFEEAARGSLWSSGTGLPGSSVLRNIA
jgi:hypothetical protein